MMVPRTDCVECSAKIAMTVLRGPLATMRLLRDCGLWRRIFLGPARVAILLIMGCAVDALRERESGICLGIRRLQPRWQDHFRRPLPRSRFIARSPSSTVDYSSAATANNQRRFMTNC
jgi:hypothetical protein